jgi:hypothetical protein
MFYMQQQPYGSCREPEISMKKAPESEEMIADKIFDGILGGIRRGLAITSPIRHLYATVGEIIAAAAA